VGAQFPVEDLPMAAVGVHCVQPVSHAQGGSATVAVGRIVVQRSRLLHINLCHVTNHYGLADFLYKIHSLADF